MIRKAEIGSNENFRCCLCYHVRTGTLILGIWHLVLHILAFALLFSVLVHPEGRNRFSSWSSGTANPRAVNGVLASDYYSPQLPDISAGPAATYAFGRERWHVQDVHVALAVVFCTGILTLFLLYGTIMGKPNYLLPFFSLQVFDFIISALTAVGYFSYIQDVRRMFEEATDMPFQKQLVHLDPEWLCAFIMVAVVICMVLKAYCMGIVWACYKYLKYLQVAHVIDNYIEADVEALLPPDYDTATKMPPHAPTYAPPPPPYTPASNGI